MLSEFIVVVFFVILIRLFLIIVQIISTANIITVCQSAFQREICCSFSFRNFEQGANLY